MHETGPSGPPPWGGTDAQALVRAGNVGGLIRWARVQLGWRQAELGTKAGYSTATVSRTERTTKITDLNMARAFADAVGMPAGVLSAVLRISPEGATSRPSVEKPLTHDPEDDSMLRRTLLTAGLAIPAAFLASVDDALASVPTSSDASTALQVRSKLAGARGDFDKGDYAKVISGLPSLLAASHTLTAGGKASGYDFALLAACYDLATDAMSKVGAYDTGRITADRSTVYSDLSGSPLAAASSARMLSIVLRHRGEAERAARVTLDGAGKVEATGLKTAGQTALYAQMLASCSYTAASAGDRTSALELIAEAEKAASRLVTPTPMNGVLMGPNQVALYKVGTLWAVGDAGAAIDAGRHLTPGMFPTAERRARLHTDMGRAWWSWGKADKTAEALMAAFKESPQEVRDRPAIRLIVDELDRRHSRAAGVKDLVDAVTSASAPATRVSSAPGY